MPETRPHNKNLTLQLSAITGFQILVSFGMQWYVVTYFGAGAKADALYTGSTVPQLLTILLIESLTVVLVPMLSTSSKEELAERGWFLFVSMGTFFTVLALLLVFVLPLILPLIVPGFSGADKRLTVSLAQIQVFGLVGAACYSVLSSMYQARERFVVPPAATLFSGVLSVALLVWQLPHFGIKWAAWTQVFNLVLPAILLLPALGSIRKPNLQRELMKTTWRKMRPLVLSKAYYMTSAPLDRILASFLAPGSIAIFELAGRFYAAVIRIFSTGVVTPFIPHLSRLAHEQKWEDFRAQYRKQVLMVFVPSMTVMVIVVIGSLLGIRVFPGGSTRVVIGSLTAESLSRMCHVLIYMSALLPSMAVVNALVNGYYAKGNTRTPTLVGVCAYTAGNGIKVAGYYFGGIVGMSVAVSAYAVGYCLVLYALLEKQTKRMLAAQVMETGVEETEVPSQAVLQAADINTSAP